MELGGKVGIVTGASRGIGVRIAERMADRGMALALAARTEEGLRDTVARVQSRGVRAIAIPTDITDRAALEHLVARTTSELGPPDVLINNAGVEMVGHFEELDIARIEAAVSTNVTATMVLSRLVASGMVERGRGHIVNVSSVAGKVARPYGAVYSGTKHALVGFSWSLRAELAERGVGVSVVCPGYVTGEGMFAEREARVGPPPAALRAVTPQKVADATISAIEKNKAEVVVGPLLFRIADVFHALSPDLAIWAGRRGGSYRYVKKEATTE